MDTWSTRSTNGRQGVDIVFTSVEPLRLNTPARGTLTALGRAGGMQAFRFEPDEQAPTWVLVTDDAEAVEGATLVHCEDLQSSRFCSVLVLGSQAVVRHRGYKGRSIRYALYVDGVEQDVPVGVLLALGLITPKEAPAPVEAPPAPSSAFADALRTALTR